MAADSVSFLGPITFAAYFAGTVAFAGVVYTLYRPLSTAVSARDAVTDELYRKLRSFVFVLWLIYPVIWLLVPSGFGLMDAESTTLVVTSIDIVSKVGFGLIGLKGQAVATVVSTGKSDAPRAAPE